ncbi:MAG: hypothetical protein IPP48_06115 [Chitinophagaceae bacterium]|nr:hypothetical protein [Chitinophagaceae bacterium]
MNKILTILSVLTISLVYGQESKKFTNDEINIKLDSIMVEANLLYQYEKSAWISTDLANENKKIRKKFGGFLTYKSNDTIKTIIFDKERNKCIAEYIFIDDFKKPNKEIIAERNFTLTEQNLQKTKEIILEQLTDKKFDVGVPEGFNLNPILIPENEKYKLYLITGTSQSNVIPFGNDYLFQTDKNGKIESWKRFHSRLIPTYTTTPNGGKVTETTHSHLRTNPFISATDICTFKLYGKLYDLNEFSIYSPALGIYLKYNLSKDKVEIVEIVEK